MKPTIVCFSHLCNSGYITGAEKLLLFMLRELMPHYRCILVVPEEGILSHEAYVSGISYRVQACSLFPLMVEPSAGLHAQLEHARQHSEWNAMLQLLQQLKPDYVLTNTSVHALPAMAAKSLGIPVLWHITECIADNGYASEAAAIIESYADAVIGTSHTALQAFPPRNDPRSMPCRFLLPPSWHMEDLQPHTWGQHRLQKRQELGVADDSPLIGYISSSLMVQKGLDQFIHMALSIADSFPQSRFLIIGEPVNPSYLEHCQLLIQQSPHASRFTFIRFAKDIQSIYPAMDIVIVPSLIPEGFGMTALEGLVFSRAVAVYRSGGLGEIMSAVHQDEYAVEPGNWPALAAHVRRWLEQPRLLRRVQKHNGRAVQQAFGIDSYRQKLHRIFVSFIMEQESLFQAVQGSGHEIYIRMDGVFRHVASLKELKRLGRTTVRRISDDVLRELPLGEPIPPLPSSSSRKRNNVSRRNRNRFIRANKRVRHEYKKSSARRRKLPRSLGRRRGLTRYAKNRTGRTLHSHRGRSSRLSRIGRSRRSSSRGSL
ncbi:glycosyltransferase family 4 protein [Paenibacillus marinisediminis]